ncbi:MAG: tyrosine-type recombinase/integrase [Solirubrobacteraceae bacterium]
MPRKSREPTIERREHRCADGSVTEYWSVRYYDATGNRRRLRCESRAEADFQKARLVFEGPPTPAGGALVAAEDGMTLAEFWPVWAADARERLARSTMREYERLWNRRLEPQFGARPLEGIKPRDVSAWRSQLLAAGVGPEAARYAMVLLQSIFSIAIEWGEASANPVSVVRKPRQGRRKAVRPLPPEDVERLRSQMLTRNDHRSATLVSVLAYAGLRPGEALALEWRHVRDNTLLVEQAVSDGELKLQKTGRIYRTVDLLDALADDLRGWNPSPDPEAFIFPRSDGHAWRSDDWRNWRNRMFAPAAQAAGLGSPRPYDLRHSFASLLIREQRTSIVELAEQLGHAPTMTLNTYAHVFAEHRRAEPVDVAEWIARARRDAARPDMD